MTPTYPRDADGDALRRVADHGSDMSAPMDIDFAVAAPDEAAARRIATAVGRRGYATRLYHDDEDQSWSVYCTRRMLATHAGVLAAQAEVDELSQPYGGYAEG